MEIIWISIRRKNKPPFFVGCYYGKQESRVSKEEIDDEMRLLSEEIEEFRKEGNIIIFMDGNGKLGLLGEQKSRNGKLLEDVFETHNLTVLNKTSKCVGKITRQNTKNCQERSAIDFIVTDQTMEHWVQSMQIDEEGLLKISGKNCTDHNTIVLDMTIPNIEKMVTPPIIQWRLKAPQAKWEQFRYELQRGITEVKDIFKKDDISLETKYSKWVKKIESAARASIGKTTLKQNPKESFSKEVVEMRRKKRQLKNKIKVTTTDKEILIPQLKKVQGELSAKILLERTQKINDKLKYMLKDRSKVSFWKERKRVQKSPLNECFTIKDTTGKRIYNPDKIKETMAAYYENLYAKSDCTYHPHHDKVKEDIEAFSIDHSTDCQEWNQIPTDEEILNAIRNKKNGKASTDMKYEMIKGTEMQFMKILKPLLEEVWESEQVPNSWTEGSITSLYKGKGDKECLKNHRGITVSSAIGSIVQEIIDKRMEKIVQFTQGQAGGKKGSSTGDHLFLLRGMMATAIHKKTESISHLLRRSKSL